MSFLKEFFVRKKKIAEARYWVVSKVFRVSHMIVAMRIMAMGTLALRTSERLRQQVRTMALRTS